MRQTITMLPTSEAGLAATSIRELTDIEPRVMELLAPLGLDLCCGGAHPLGEALDLHGIERSTVLPGLLALAREPRNQP